MEVRPIEDAFRGGQEHLSLTEPLACRREILITDGQVGGPQQEVAPLDLVEGGPLDGRFEEVPSRGQVTSPGGLTGTRLRRHGDQGGAP
jgi:hypothetical protein